MLRYSLRTLGATVTAIAMGCAALLNANYWVASTAWTLVFLVLSLATIAAVLTRRGFWTGFAIAGWLYLLLGIGPLSGYHNGNLLTTATLRRMAMALTEEEQVPAAVDVTWNPTFTTSTLTNLIGAGPQAASGWVSYPPLYSISEPAHSFTRIGQSLWTLLLALLGGWFGAFLMARHRPAQMESSG